MKRTVKDILCILAQASGKRCWNVSVGGPTLPQLTLALGKKIKRQKPLPNPAQTSDFRAFEGEISFFIRCWWRLERRSSILASTSDDEANISAGLNRLIGRFLVQVTVAEPAWDLILKFSNGFLLRVFSNQPDNADEHLRNWHARVPGQKIYAGPGMTLNVET